MGWRAFCTKALREAQASGLLEEKCSGQKRAVCVMAARRKQGPVVKNIWEVLDYAVLNRSLYCRTCQSL